MYVNNKPVICMGCNNGVYIYSDNTWKRILISDIPEKNVVTKVIANKGKFYLSTRIGLCVLENEKPDWSLNDKLNGLSSKLLTIEFENKGTPNEKLWAMSTDCIGYFENDKFMVYKIDLTIPEFSIGNEAFMCFHKSKKIFFGNNWKKYYLDRNTSRVFPLMSNNGFTSNGALSVFNDNEDNVWFADSRGLDKISKMSIVNYFEINGMLENEVSAFMEFKDGTYLLGHNNGLTLLENDNKFRRIPFNSGKFHSTRVLDMFRDRDGDVWFTANELGVGKIKPDGNIKWYSNNDNAVYSCIQQDMEGRIWVGSNYLNRNRNKIYFLKDGKFVEYEHSDKVNNTIRKIFPSDKGGVYVAGINGLWYLDDKEARRVPSSEGSKSENVYAYYKNKAGIEFVGTSNGLFAIEDGKIVKYNKNGINITRPVYFILQDGDGNYWLGSNDGVFKWDGEGKLEVLNTHNGLSGHETNRAAGLLDSKGRVWIGTDLGLTCYMPEYNHIKIPVPKVNLLDLEDSKGVQYYLDENNSVPYIDNTLIFNFRGISYVNEDLMVYRYKLEGYDKDWQEVKQSMLDKVKYIDVRPGEYKFSVMVKNFSGEWSEVKTSGSITIESPFYKSWWFVILVFLIFGVMVGSLVKIKDQKYQNSKLEKEIKYRKRIEQDLNDSKRKYQDIVELLPEAIYETDIDGRFTYANSYGLKLLNFTQEDLIRGVKVEDVIVPEEQDMLEENRKLVFEDNMDSRIEYTCLSKDGKRIPLSINAVPILKDGKIAGIRGIAADMTGHKKVQEALMKYAEDLKSLNASKDKFFSIVAHDLKNPFQGLLGFSDFLHTDYENMTEDEKKEYIGYIRTTSKNAYNLLDNLLQWSRLQTGRIEVAPVKLNLFTAISSVLELCISNAIRKRISVSNNADTNVFVNADSNMLNSILQNLISNAIKFTNQNGEIYIDCELKDGFIEIKISDNGTGMDSSTLNKLFRIDQHLSGIGTMKETGTGLGLILCKEMIELNGGVIKAESEKGKGSTFSFTIPLA
ncbi:MAG: ATP-binding protein, partial [Ignavibacteria bacterium]